MTATSSNVTCIEGERRSLLAIKHKITDRFNLLSTWSGVECCEWRGIGCDSRNGHVVKLDLRSPVSLEDLRSLVSWEDEKWLEGELSPWLQNLKHLRYLDLSMNNFYGKIPEFLGSFESLEYLNLSRSGFSEGVVPHHLGNLSSLQVLDLRNVFIFDDVLGAYFAPIVDDLRWVSSLSSLRYLDLSGITIGKHADWFHPVNMLPSLLTLNLASTCITIPSTQFVNFTSLNSLNLADNGMNSTIPLWLSNLTSLMHLNLYWNSLHGKIPDFLGTFSTLASIDLSDNSFDTSMPDLLCNLSSLVRLDLSINNFYGSVPSNLGLLSRLEYLNLRYNQLSGNIPMVSNLVCLDISGNMFSGPIPASLGLFSRLEDLSLYDNQFGGNIPSSLGQLSKLKNLDLSRNSLVGVLSETHFTNLKNLIHLDMSWNSLALNFSSRWTPPFQLQKFSASSCSNIGPYFPNWLHTQTHLQRLDLSNSSIRDTIPQWFESILSHILYLDLSNNQIGGKMPLFHFDTSNRIWDSTLKMNSNKFEGSLAAFPSNVKLLDLSDNLLSGEVPQTDGTMNLTLETVNLSKNRFTGNIPEDLCNLSNITVLDLSQNKLSGRLPECLGNLIYLEAMDLSNNTIIGVVPSSLGSFTQLLTLHLHNNRFEGNLPLSLQNLTSLVTMDIGYNFLMGDIPFWIGRNLINLRILNLQSNKFTGKIPLQFCQLNALHHLNLAQNNIIGTIPPCFANLSGMITDEGSINYSINNYEENMLASTKGNQLGNDGLCGPPLSRSCKGDNSSYDHVGKVEAQDEDEDFWLYIGMGAAVVFAVVRGRQAVFVEPLSLSCCRRSVVVEPLSYAIIRIERLIQFVVVISVCTVETIDWRKLWNRLLWEVIYQQHPYITTVDPDLILKYLRISHFHNFLVFRLFKHIHTSRENI
ncbi:hypothetical protein E3N88_37760 [Mikania micrantha]|uniref:Uncharacterized protein n=1 Tax=Mikania micrantha TaxID=192012 RepID=A0A5N6LS46_9ASTR|nr:hypothetical protein E3N88_37760 [Mikania micrantha]